MPRRSRSSRARSPVVAYRLGHEVPASGAVARLLGRAIYSRGCSPEPQQPIGWRVQASRQTLFHCDRSFVCGEAQAPGSRGARRRAGPARFSGASRRARGVLRSNEERSLEQDPGRGSSRGGTPDTSGAHGSAAMRAIPHGKDRRQNAAHLDQLVRPGPRRGKQEQVHIAPPARGGLAVIRVQQARALVRAAPIARAAPSPPAPNNSAAAPRVPSPQRGSLKSSPFYSRHRMALIQIRPRSASSRARTRWRSHRNRFLRVSLAFALAPSQHPQDR